MPGARTAFCLVLSLVAVPSFAQSKSEILLLSVDRTTDGPFGGQKSSSCLRLYSDGTLHYVSAWTSASSRFDDTTGKKIEDRHFEAFEQRLDKLDVFELSQLFQSRKVRSLPERFAPPHRPIDYFETQTVAITAPGRTSKSISTREYYVASLEEKTRYPAALVVLLDQIPKLEEDAAKEGKPISASADCPVKLESKD